MFEHVFQEIQLRDLVLSNRVVFPAMGSRYCTSDGYALEQMADYHAARAKGGCGLNIVEAAAVYKPGAVTRMLQITDDSYIPRLKMVTDAIHKNGGKACLQLWQAGIAAQATPGALIVVPSDLPLGADRVIPGVSKEIIEECIEAFGAAAARAVEAGFDCVEFHAAHNYSPHHFLCPALNRRTDEYGGSLENRARYTVESIRAIRANIPEGMPILVRLPSQDDELPVGLTVEDIIEVAKMCKEAGADVLDISRGNLVTSAMRYEVPSLDIPRGFNVDLAAKIRQETKMPTIAVGRINDPAQAEEILASGKADMVVIGRGQLADAEFCKKAEEGHVDDIVRCVGCNQGCYDRTLIGEPITCMRNPSVGREKEFESLKTAEHPKRVLVIGGGVAGMEAAIMAKKLGHDVTLAEAEDHLGGQFLLAGKAPRKEEIEAATIQRGMQAEKAGVRILRNTRVDTAYLEAFAPDAVIDAIGASPLIPAIEGLNPETVITGADILSGRKKAEGSVAVVGGGLVGLEVAEYVRAQGNEVTVVEMQDAVAKDVGPGRSTSIQIYIQAAKIRTVVNAAVKKITDEGVVAEINGTEQLIPADTVVIAVGSRANSSDEILAYCEKNEIPCRIVGDAVKARRALQAVHEGAQAAMEL